MKKDQELTTIQMTAPSLITSVLHKPQRKNMSRYMIKKQINNIDKILHDPQIMDI